MRRAVFFIICCFCLLLLPIRTVASDKIIFPIEWLPDHPRAVGLNVELRWKLVDDVDNYKIFCNAQLISKLSIKQVTIENDNYGVYTDKGKEPGEYIYKIIGIVQKQEIARSTAKTLEIKSDETAIPPPYDLMGRFDRGKVALNWGTIYGGYENFKIYRSENQGKDYKLLSTLPKFVNKYWDTGIEPGKTYHYAVIGVDRYNTESVKSNIYIVEYKMEDAVEEETELAREIQTELISVIYPVDKEGNSYDENYPGGQLLAVDCNRDKDILLIEFIQKEVQIFRHDGKFLDTYKGIDSQTLEGKLFGPMSLSVANSGDYFILDASRNMILSINKRGGFVKEFSVVPSSKQLKYPVGTTKMGIDRKNKLLFVNDLRNLMIYVYDYQGFYRGSLGEPGRADGQFGSPGKVWVDKQGNIYIVDMLQCRIQVFDKDKNFKFTFGSPGDNALGSFARPVSIAVNSKGKIYVVDWLQQVVQVFNNDGSPIGAIRRPNGKDVLMEPIDITIDKDDNIYICEAGNRRVIVFKDNE